jgi:hypothetical protein
MRLQAKLWYEEMLLSELRRHPRAWKSILKDYCNRQWETRIVWGVLRLIPAEVKYWVVVQAAVNTQGDGGPDAISATDMLKVMKP